MANTREILRRSNELGYFPTAAQAERVHALLAVQHARRMELVPELSGSRVDDALFTLCLDWAIGVVFRR